MKSTLFNMILVLFCITLLSAVGVGGVYIITKDPIAKAKSAAQTEAIGNVLPAFDDLATEKFNVGGLPIVVNVASKSGKVVGYAIESMTKNGFSGVIRLMVGFDYDGKVINVNVLEQSETPGLGTKMADDGNPLLLSFKDKNLENMNISVKKDGGDVDALTAATISSRAYAEAMSRAYDAFRKIRFNEELPADTYSGATQTEDGEWSEQADSLAEGEDVKARLEEGDKESREGKRENKRQGKSTDTEVSEQGDKATQSGDKGREPKRQNRVERNR